ncbi:hypothetical protein [Bacillus mycoides]|uniref:hypothetical protein n=1 Tax=Bacillus mycoides TaxID=1405 RepID=UPI003A7F8AB1
MSLNVTIKIEEVLSEKLYRSKWDDMFFKDRIEVKMIANCYGSLQEKTVIFASDEWEEAKERGYFDT